MYTIYVTQGEVGAIPTRARRREVLRFPYCRVSYPYAARRGQVIGAIALRRLTHRLHRSRNIPWTNALSDMAYEC